jgi:hypothetical protein
MTQSLPDLDKLSHGDPPQVDVYTDGGWAAIIRWDEACRFLLRCEPGAAYFRLYGIERDDVDYTILCSSLSVAQWFKGQAVPHPALDAAS